MIDRKRIRSLVETLSHGGTITAKQLATDFRAMGFTANMHVGKEMKTGDDTCVEWYCGSFIDIVDDEAWFAVNSWINCVDKFCPEVFTEEHHQYWEERTREHHQYWEERTRK